MKPNSQPPDGLGHPVAPTSEIPEKGAPRIDRRGDLLVLGLVAPFAGLGCGLICAMFRMELVEADRVRNDLIAWAQGEKIGRASCRERVKGWVGDATTQEEPRAFGWVVTACLLDGA